MTLGRKSAAELAEGLTTAPRLEPPSHLTPAEAAEWRAVVADKPPAWFTQDTVILLEGYCKSAVRMRWMETQVDEAQGLFEVALESGEPKDALAAAGTLEKFVKMKDLTMRGLLAYATKMRLTPQARYEPAVAATAARKVAQVGAAKKPWEDESLGLDEIGLAGSA